MERPCQWKCAPETLDNWASVRSPVIKGWGQPCHSMIDRLCVLCTATVRCFLCHYPSGRRGRPAGEARGHKRSRLTSPAPPLPRLLQLLLTPCQLTCASGPPPADQWNGLGAPLAVLYAGESGRPNRSGLVRAGGTPVSRPAVAPAAGAVNSVRHKCCPQRAAALHPRVIPAKAGIQAEEGRGCTVPIPPLLSSWGETRVSTLFGKNRAEHY